MTANEQYREREGRWYAGVTSPSAKSIYHGPMCRCGSRETQRIGDSALNRFCHSCGETYSYRISDGVLVPYTPLTALALDEQRGGA
jgi:hypothetical protein